MPKNSKMVLDSLVCQFQLETMEGGAIFSTES
jgi:hypothetical protein